MKRIANELATIAVAVQFLTRLPVPAAAYTPARLAASVRWYPLVGIVIGSIAAATYGLAAQVWTPVLAALLATAATLVVTGAFHEDGLADLFDGLGTASRERMLEVMRDSRLGTFGAVAIGIVLAVKITTLSALPLRTTLAALIAAHAVSRFSSVLAIATSRYARDTGTAKPVAEGIAPVGLLVAAITALLACTGVLLIDGTATLTAAIVGAACGHVVTRLLYEARLGGYTGDCLGAVQQLSEIGFYLGVLAWR